MEPKPDPQQETEQKRAHQMCLKLFKIKWKILATLNLNYGKNPIHLNENTTLQ